MSDQKLREFFEENRRALDVETPPLDLWDAIEQELDGDEKEESKGKTLWLYTFMKAAAVLLVAFGLGYSVAHYNIGPSKTVASVEKKADTKNVELAKIAPEMVEVEGFYVANIASFKKQIKSYQNVDETLVKEFLDEHDALDKMYDELKQMLLQDVDNEKIVNLMIQNLQMRMSVLEKQKNILQNIKEQKSDKNEKNTRIS